MTPRAAQSFTWGENGELHSIGFMNGGRWKVQLYDKKKELQNKWKRSSPADRPPIEAAIDQADGILRFECRTLTEVNKEKGITTLGDLTDESLASVNRSFFDKCRFGQEVEGWSKVHRVMVESLEDSASTKDIAGMLTHLMYLSEGLESPRRSRNTIQKHRRLAENLGVSEVDFQVSDSKAMQLDYESGTMVDLAATPKLVYAA